MTIEFHTPSGKVKEWIMIFLMRKLMDLHNSDQDISRVQVYLREQSPGLKSCAIDVTIYGDSLFVSRTAFTYEEAVLQALAECQEKLPKMKIQPPTVMVSTVSV
jgi:hypothetical protein